MSCWFFTRWRRPTASVRISTDRMCWRTASRVPHGSPTGWLNRALNNLPAAARLSRERGVALAQNVPLVLRGPAAVSSWSPSVLPDLDPDTLRRIADRYASDPILSQRLADALATDQLAEQASQSSVAPAADAADPTAMAAVANALHQRALSGDGAHGGGISAPRRWPVGGGL